MLGLSELAKPESLAQSYQHFAEMWGYVPKARYEALEEEYQALLVRFREMEGRLEQLQSLKSLTPEVSEQINLWQDSMQKTLEQQQSWWQSWSEAFSPEKLIPDKKVDKG
ncbi:MAG: hypothetical protein R2865_01900 [Deinococcales bacterium]